MAGDLNIALILKLVDKATKPARDAIGTLTGAARRSSMADADIAASAERRNRILKQSAVAAGASIAGALSYAVAEAVRFEESMADVGKVLDMSRPDIAALGEDILDLSKTTPLAAEGIAAIVAAAGQAGVVSSALPDDEERAQLLAFASDAAKMAVAFDDSATEAGDAKVAMRNRLKLTQPEVRALSDAINHLGNNTGASSGDILNVVSRVGSLAQIAGLATTDVAALSSAFVASAKSPEIAATSLQNFVLALTAGNAATDKQRAVFRGSGSMPPRCRSGCRSTPRARSWT